MDTGLLQSSSMPKSPLSSEDHLYPLSSRHSMSTGSPTTRFVILEEVKEPGTERKSSSECRGLVDVVGKIKMRFLVSASHRNSREGLERGCGSGYSAG